jgi:hypothetical protein
VLVDALFGLPAVSVATLAAMFAITVPGVDIPVTATSNFVPFIGATSVTVAVVAPAVPEIVTSPVVNVPAADSVNTTVK